MVAQPTRNPKPRTMRTRKIRFMIPPGKLHDAQRIAGKRRAETKPAKLDDAVRRVRFTGLFGLGCRVERELTRPTVPDACIEQTCSAYPEPEAKRSGAQRGAP